MSGPSLRATTPQRQQQRSRALLAAVAADPRSNQASFARLGRRGRLPLREISELTSNRNSSGRKGDMADPKSVLEFAKRNDVKILDLRFTDLPGLWHHISYPIEQLTEAGFEEGFGMDGSSIRGWAAIH